MSALPNLNYCAAYEAASQNQRAKRQRGGYGEGGHGLGLVRAANGANHPPVKRMQETFFENPDVTDTAAEFLERTHLSADCGLVCLPRATEGLATTRVKRLYPVGDLLMGDRHDSGRLRFRKPKNLRWQVFAGNGGLDTICDCAGQLVRPLRYSGSRNADGFGRCGGRSTKKADCIGFLHDTGHLSSLSQRRASTLSVKPAQMLTMLTLKERAERALAAGFSNAQLAEAAGVTSGAVSQWLTNTKRLKAKSAIGLAKLTGWRVEWWAEGIGLQTDAPHGNVDTQAQPLSHSQQQDTHTASEVGGGQQTISPDEIFKAMSVRERVRFARLLSAAFDDPPEIGVTVEGELWVRNDLSNVRPQRIDLDLQRQRSPTTVKRGAR